MTLALIHYFKINYYLLFILYLTHNLFKSYHVQNTYINKIEKDLNIDTGVMDDSKPKSTHTM